MIADRQTHTDRHTHTQTRSSQYSAHHRGGVTTATREAKHGLLLRVAAVRGSSELSAASDEHLVRPGDGFPAVADSLEEGRHVVRLCAARAHLLPCLHRHATLQGNRAAALNFIIIIIFFIFFLTPVLNSRGMKKLRYAI